jgi:thiol-disulfide isomerase/thioredoxin
MNTNYKYTDFDCFCTYLYNLPLYRYYAPWCKKCQHVGLHFRKLAAERGDGVIARKQVMGEIKCAEIEYSDVTAPLLDALQIKAVPTLQLYRGTTLLWSATGKSLRVQEMSREIATLMRLSPSELAHHVASLASDSRLEQAMEDSFFDNDFGYCYDWEDQAQCL